MIKVIKGEYSKIDVHAIVYMVNESLLDGGSVDREIHRAVGSQLLEECQTLHGCPTGEAKQIKGYNLPADYVIHTVGLIWHGRERRETDILTSYYYKSLTVAIEDGIHTIAFPPISIGKHGYLVDKAAKVTVHTVNRFLSDNFVKTDIVYWVLFDDCAFAAYESESL